MIILLKIKKKGSSLFGIIQLLLFHLDDDSAVIEPASMHAVMMWSALCSCAPHSQLQEGARPRLCMYNKKLPMPVCKRSSLTQAGLGKLSPSGFEPIIEIKPSRYDGMLKYLVFHVTSVR